MKLLNEVSQDVFTRFQQENMDSALSLIGDGVKKKNLRNQVAARLLGFRAFESIEFSLDSQVSAQKPAALAPEFDFKTNYDDLEFVDLTRLCAKVPDLFVLPYPEHSEYLECSKPISITLNATPILLSILPVLLDSRSPWHDDVMTGYENGLEVHKPNFTGDNAPCYFERRDGFDDYPGYMEQLKLLCDTQTAPDNLLGVSSLEHEIMWINQHYKSSLQLLCAEVQQAFSRHLDRIDFVQKNGYGESAPFKKEKSGE